MAREYVLVISALSSLTTVPFAQIACPATTGIEIIRVELGQEASTTSAQNVLTFARRSTASTLPTSTTPARLNANDAVSKLTGSTTTNAQGIATVTGTLDEILGRYCFNVLNGMLWVPVPEERIQIAPSGFFTLQFANTPTAVVWSGQIVFAETD